jgi:hypothetical protein
MKTKILSLIVLSVILILHACSPFTISDLSGQQPTPEAAYASTSTGYQPVIVDHVEVEVGVGSPIPVIVHISGSLPDACSQIEYTEVKQDGSNFIISLSATPAADDCVKDALPFRMSIPLNVIDLPAGSYSATVNGSRADFELATGSSTTPVPLRTADMPVTKDDIQVDNVHIEIGNGSPIPVRAIVSGSLPNACAQLGEIRLHRADTTFFARLVAYGPVQSHCNPDTVPFRLEIPLNVVNLPEGPYEVNINGATASFDPRAVPAAPANDLAERNLILIEHVGVQAGQGSPIPVEIIASGTWPDRCAQIAEVQSSVNGFNMDFTILASTVESCPPDQLGLPFRFAIPLNIVEMQAGTYTITVNGVSTTFDLPLSR